MLLEAHRNAQDAAEWFPPADLQSTERDVSSEVKLGSVPSPHLASDALGCSGERAPQMLVDYFCTVGRSFACAAVRSSTARSPSSLN